MEKQNTFWEFFVSTTVQNFVAVLLNFLSPILNTIFQNIVFEEDLVD